MTKWIPANFNKGQMKRKKRKKEKEAKNEKKYTSP